MMGFGMGFGIFEILFFIVFGLVLCVFVAAGISALRQWHSNQRAPRLSVPARVVAKRTRVGHRGGSMHDGHAHSYTAYYVTFEVESGDRMELQVDGPQSGLMVEGDQGTLSFQGTRFLDFQRRQTL